MPQVVAIERSQGSAGPNQRLRRHILLAEDTQKRPDGFGVRLLPGVFVNQLQDRRVGRRGFSKERREQDLLLFSLMPAQEGIEGFGDFPDFSKIEGFQSRLQATQKVSDPIVFPPQMFRSLCDHKRGKAIGVPRRGIIPGGADPRKFRARAGFSGCPNGVFSGAGLRGLDFRERAPASGAPPPGPRERPAC